MEPRDPNRPPTAALPGFVSTAVLTSSDGLFGDNVEEQRISTTPAGDRALDAADYKPLYERLQEMKDEKDREWKEKNNPFAPPKALDDEEIEFIRDLESRQADSAQQRRAREQEDRAEFLLARESAKNQAPSKDSASATTAPKLTTKSVATLSDLAGVGHRKPHNARPTPPAVVVVAKKPKRKATEITTESHSAVKPSTKKKVSAADDQGKAVVVAANQGSAGPSVVTPNVTLGLVGYGSDSDESS